MNATLTKTIGDRPHGWVLYDGECRFCRKAIARLHAVLLRRHFHTVPLQTEWVRQRLGLKPGELPNEMKLLDDQGRIFGGAEAWIQIARTIWWTYPMYAISDFPGVRPVMHTAYHWIAANRHCLGGQCGTEPVEEIHRRHDAFFKLP